MSSPSGAFGRLVERHYAILRSIAARAIRSRTVPEQMSPSSLVAETVLRLMAQRKQPQSEAHLRGLATVFMTRVLTDRVRARRALRRGSGRKDKSLDDPSVALDLSSGGDHIGQLSPGRVLVEHHELLNALEVLARTMPVEMEVLTLHIAAGIPMHRVAAMTGMSKRSADRAMAKGKQALAAHLQERLN